MSLTGHNNGRNAIVKFTRLLQETQSQLTAPLVPKIIFYQPAVGKPKPADLQIDCETEMWNSSPRGSSSGEGVRLSSINGGAIPSHTCGSHDQTSHYIDISPKNSFP